MPKKRRHITKARKTTRGVTVRDVVDHLGGVAAVAELTQRSATCVHNWIRYDQFSARVYLVMSHALSRRGMSAPPELWGQDQIAA